MVATVISPPCSQCVELRWQAHLYKSLHARAVQREGFLKDEVNRLTGLVHQQQKQITQLTEEKETLQAQLTTLQQLHFGRTSEQTSSLPSPLAPDPGAPAVPPVAVCPRPRGQQPGAPGHGRQSHPTLPVQEVLHDLTADQRHCPRCKNPFVPFPGTEDSIEIHWEVHLIRRVHKRARYRSTCHCSQTPGLVIAPAPPKLIPKGLFSVEFWVQILSEKFLSQRPLYRTLQRLALQGLVLSPGTLTGGLRRLLNLLEPLYLQILERNRAARHWHMDETRWPVFAEVEGKKPGTLWWLWISITQDTCTYFVDPSRSAAVPKTHLGPHPQGILNVDRYSAYKALDLTLLQLAFCWSHVRRDFLRVQKGYPRSSRWAQQWLDLIDDLFRKNAQRLAAKSLPELFAGLTQALSLALADMRRLCQDQLADPRLSSASRQVLQSLQAHWPGLILFVDHPEIPMDNNAAERGLRNPVIGRKNYYGSGALWSARLAAVAFTLFQTLLLNRLNPPLFLTAYFHACATNKGRVPWDLDSWLPWNLSEHQKAAWRFPASPAPP